MLEQIRNATRSWASMVVIGLLVVSFALWGVNDIFLGGNNAPIIKVGETEVTAEGFARELDLAFRQGRNQYGAEYTMAVALDFGLADQVTDEMVTRIVLGQLASDVGVRTSDDELSRQIAANPVFQGATGSFDINTYREYLYQLRLTPSQFEELMRVDMERTQLLASLASGASIPVSMANVFYGYAYEQRALEYFVLPPVAVETPADPGDDVLQAYFDTNAVRYIAPEYRTITVLYLSPEDMAVDAYVPEEDVLNMYEIRRDSLATPERRSLRQLSFVNRDDAVAALAALEAGTPFDEAGGTLITLDDVTGGEVIDDTVREVAFGMAEPGMSGVIDGRLSTSIVSVDSITPGVDVAFEDVRDEIRDELAARVAEEEIYSLSQTVQDQYAAGLPLEDIGQTLHVPVFTVDSVDVNGQSPEGARLESVLSIDGLLDMAFRLGEGAQSQLEENLDGTFYIVRVDSITPDRQKNLSEVREEVLRTWRATEIDRLLQNMAEAASTRINDGEDFTAVAAELGRQVRAPDEPVRRSETDEVFSRTTLQRLFDVPLNETVAASMRLGQGWIVARATRVVEAERNAESITTLQTELAQNLQGEILETFVDQARATSSVQINQNAINDLVNSIPR